jgi:hypothetical protein
MKRGLILLVIAPLLMMTTMMAAAPPPVVNEATVAANLDLASTANLDMVGTFNIGTLPDSGFLVSEVAILKLPACGFSSANLLVSVDNNVQRVIEPMVAVVVVNPVQRVISPIGSFEYATLTAKLAEVVNRSVQRDIQFTMCVGNVACHPNPNAFQWTMSLNNEV